MVLNICTSTWSSDGERESVGASALKSALQFAEFVAVRCLSSGPRPECGPEQDPWDVARSDARRYGLWQLGLCACRVLQDGSLQVRPFTVWCWQTKVSLAERSDQGIARPRQWHIATLKRRVEQLGLDCNRLVKEGLSYVNRVQEGESVREHHRRNETRKQRGAVKPTRETDVLLVQQLREMVEKLASAQMHLWNGEDPLLKMVVESVGAEDARGAGVLLEAFNPFLRLLIHQTVESMRENDGISTVSTTVASNDEADRLGKQVRNIDYG